MKALVLWAAAQWCVTRGHVDGEGRVDQPKMRAVLPGSDGNSAQVRFTYRGASQPEEPLASGLPRRQIGLKLRAQDPCNLVYVMWRLHPETQLVVSVKRNPGHSRSTQCGNGGYRNLKPRRTGPLPSGPGNVHTLEANISGRTLRAWADHVLVWEGDLDEETLALAGPAGVRSDNGRFDLEVRASGGPEKMTCRSAGED